MDRDRERDRERDRDRRDDRFSNTYRPRSPGPRIDSYRSNRSPPRGRGVLAADTYTPGVRASRPRSRSPAFRRRSRSPRRDDDRWRARPRSPPRRGYSPRREDFRNDRGRSPRREGYDSYTRSPRVRERSPLPPRDPSPARSRGMRSPLRLNRYDDNRSRAQSPYRRYSPARDVREHRRRSPSPRRDRPDPYTADTWRRRSPSPGRPAFASNDVSGRESVATSRRSSPPPVHPSRAAIVPEDRPLREVASAPRSPYRERDDRERERDYDRERDFGRERERERERERGHASDRSPVQHRDTPPTGPRGDREFAPPSGPSSAFRNGDVNSSRAPPTGPSNRGYPVPAASPPAGPSNTAPQPPAYPRNNNPVLAAPTRPSGRGRGGFGYDAPSRDFSGPPPRRGSAAWGGRGAGGGGYYGGMPSGPRGSVGGPSPVAPPFRGSSNSTSTTYPRTQRFRDHLADLPKEVPGGIKAPDLYDKTKITKLEEETRLLREKIEQRETIKRQKLRSWDAAEKDTNNTTLRAELAEQHLRSLNGENEVGGAAF